MVYKCSAFGCKSGYASQSASSRRVKVTFHTYPLKNKRLLELWIQRNPRNDFFPSKYSRLCSLHFEDSDFVTTSQDTNHRRRRRASNRLKVRYLKPGAVPSIFPKLECVTEENSDRGVSSCTSLSKRSMVKSGHVKVLKMIPLRDHVSW